VARRMEVFPLVRGLPCNPRTNIEGLPFLHVFG
jgi:hypothetical protein